MYSGQANACPTLGVVCSYTHIFDNKSESASLIITFDKKSFTA